MSSPQLSNESATRVPSAKTIETKLEVITIPVSDIDEGARR